MNFIMCADFILDDIGEYVQNLLDSLKKGALSETQ